MAQQIDPIKLREAAEHLEWVLHQYRGHDVPQTLLHSLADLLDAAKLGRINAPINDLEIPGSYEFGDRQFSDFKDPSIDDAYAKFGVELRGGLTEEEKRFYAEMSAYRNSLPEKKP